MQTLAFHISEATLPLITLLNGGVEPSRSAFGDYYICTIKDNDTIDHKIISLAEYRNTHARYASRFDVNHWK
jgi:hypothetical protein